MFRTLILAHIHKVSERIDFMKPLMAFITLKFGFLVITLGQLNNAVGIIAGFLSLFYSLWKLYKNGFFRKVSVKNQDKNESDFS